MKLKNIEYLLKRVKGIPYQLRERNRTIGKITSFGYQVVSDETADRIFAALTKALEERGLLIKLKDDVERAFRTLGETERGILSSTCCKERTIRETAQLLCRPPDEVRAAYRRAMRKMSKFLSETGYDEIDLEIMIELLEPKEVKLI